jgi:hypothetical protein
LHMHLVLPPPKFFDQTTPDDEYQAQACGMTGHQALVVKRTLAWNYIPCALMFYVPRPRARLGRDLQTWGANSGRNLQA